MIYGLSTGKYGKLFLTSVYHQKLNTNLKVEKLRAQKMMKLAIMTASSVLVNVNAIQPQGFS